MTLDAAYARPLGPQRFADGYYGYGLFGSIEKALGKNYSVGLGFQTIGITNQSADNFALSSFDVIGRRWFSSWRAFNPYFLMGVGGNLFRDSYKKPFGDVFHAQAALGSTFVFDTHWALDYAIDWHVMAPLTTPHHWVGARLGLVYRYGTQPHVNQIAPPPVEATGVDQLSEERLRELLGTVRYKVRPGDTLWRIAKRQKLLGKNDLWPLIVKYNGDIISNPNLIEPGMILIIPRNLTEEQLNEAVRIAQADQYKRRKRALKQ